MSINFEGHPDGTVVTNQYSGLTFSRTTIITAGFTLNEFEFPPRSGTNVAFDDGGSISILFSQPIFQFSGFFTYTVPLTLSAFDAGSNLVAQTTSTFSSNLALSGNPGSSPNELLQLFYGPGISSITISGDPLGSSFTFDDVTDSDIPEPAAFVTGLTAILLTLLFFRKRA